MTVSKRCFIDTNLLVYARDPAEPGKQNIARRWLAALQTSESARISFQVIQEFYNVVTRKLSPGLAVTTARADVEDFLKWHPVATTPALIKTAWQIQDDYRLSWWDCLVMAAAQHAKCDILLSEDFSAGQDYDGVRVINPFATEPKDVLR